ncbi:MAG: hypothetical protein JEZ08_09805 [Clostridiales bacterium]|nr:hypothetical protein [Clostridiales bacterium]
MILFRCNKDLEDNEMESLSLTNDNSTLRDSNTMPDKMPSDFQIVFTFGVEQANQHSGINTVEGTIQKDLVLDGLASLDIVISGTDLEKIYELIQKSNIVSYPKNYKPAYMENPPKDSSRMVTPSNVYKLWIQYDNTEYSLYWHDSNASEIEEAIILREALEEIKKIIRSLDEYDDLGQSNGGYD